jgi:hypothetical protein
MASNQIHGRIDGSATAPASTISRPTLETPAQRQIPERASWVHSKSTQI